MKRKLPIILVASSAIMLAASTIGSTKATLTYMSDNYLAQIDIKSIGVTLTENGNDVSWRDYKHKDDDWSEATGVLLGDMLKNAGDGTAAWNIMFAGATISIVPILIVYCCFSRFFMGGLTAGAVKG